jgi:SAM-dependent methyltransferase
MAHSPDPQWNEITIPLQGKTCLEIGGPTELFYNPVMLPCYSIFSSIDNINNITYTNFPNVTDTSHSGHFRATYSLDCTSEALLAHPKKYDVLLTSHVIEHIANPILFLKRAANLLNPDGYILTILPNKTQFWDRTRPTTTIEHLLSDYTNNTQEDDMTHLEEVLETDHPWRGQKGEVEFRRLCLNNKETRTIHHHCFDSPLVQALHEAAGYTTERCEVLPHNPLQIVYRGRKSS